MGRKKKDLNGTTNGVADHEQQELEHVDEPAADAADALPEPAPPVVEEPRFKPTRYLRHDLSKKEHRLMGKQLSENFKTMEEEEGRLANLTDDVKRAKGKIAGLEGDNRRLSRTMRDGFEYRDVECREEREERLGQIDTIRCDTNQVIESRAMTAKERQGSLFDESALGAAAQ